MRYIQVRTQRGDLLTYKGTLHVQVSDPHSGFCGCDMSGCLRCLGLRLVPIEDLNKGDTCIIPVAWTAGGASAVVVGDAPQYLGRPITRCPPGSATGVSPW